MNVYVFTLLLPVHQPAAETDDGPLIMGRGDSSFQGEEHHDHGDKWLDIEMPVGAAVKALRTSGQELSARSEPMIPSQATPIQHQIRWEYYCPNARGLENQ